MDKTFARDALSIFGRNFLMRPALGTPVALDLAVSLLEFSRIPKNPQECLRLHPRLPKRFGKTPGIFITRVVQGRPQDSHKHRFPFAPDALQDFVKLPHCSLPSERLVALSVFVSGGHVVKRLSLVATS